MSATVGSSSTLGHNPWNAHMAIIEDVHPEIAAVATYRLRLLEPPSAQGYRFQPGQFNMLYLPGCGEAAISLSGAPSSAGAFLLHTIRVVGRVTEAIARLQPGDRIAVRGPFGTPWPVQQCLNRDVIIVAGGIGLAPLRPLIYEIMERRSEFARVVLLVGARSPDLLLYSDELARWSGQGIEVEITVDRADDHWTGNIGVVPLLLDRLKQLRPNESVVLMCGPEVMMHYSALSALHRGVPRDSVWLSVERNMQCAVALCGHCQLGPTFVCREGPVFRYDALEPFLKVRDL